MKLVVSVLSTQTPKQQRQQICTPARLYYRLAYKNSIELKRNESVVFESNRSTGVSCDWRRLVTRNLDYFQKSRDKNSGTDQASVPLDLRKLGSSSSSLTSIQLTASGDRFFLFVIVMRTIPAREFLFYEVIDWRNTSGVKLWIVPFVRSDFVWLSRRCCWIHHNHVN